jgi:small-conductance mechanosensitive channel
MVNLNYFNLNEAFILVKIASIVVILIGGYIFAHILSNLVKNILKNLEIDKIISRESKFKFKIESRLVNLVKYGMYILTVLLIMKQLNIDEKIIFLVITLGIVGSLFLVLLNLADIIPNFIAGIRIKNKKNIKEGQKIKVGDIEGRIIDIGLIETKLKHKEHALVIPNRLLIKKRVKLMK